MPSNVVCFVQLNPFATPVDFNPRLFENTRQGMVFTSLDLRSHGIYLRTADVTPPYPFRLSIVICTYGRPESLNETLSSLTKQHFKDFEVILVTEKGDLSKLRDKGLRSATGDIVSFIDDDVYCPPTWARSVIEGFREGVVGVSGPTNIHKEFRNNRDVFKFRRIKHLYDLWFLGEKAKAPGMLSVCGAPSTRSNDSGQEYEGKVDFLEACNMSVKKKEAIDVGGFDHNYIRTAEWCEVDLALKLRAKGNLYYSRSAGLEHRPSVQGVYKHRLSTKHRWENFLYFQRKWEGRVLDRCIKTYSYRMFVWTYFKIKELGWV